MEFLRRATNPWGQEVIVGVAWDLLWAAVAAGVAFVVVHTILVMRLRKAAEAGEAGGGPAGAAAGGDQGSVASGSLPQQIVRHNLASRVFHWTMAAAMFALLITAFVPVMGFQFDWVTIHWVAGLILFAAILYHILHAVFFKSLMSVWVGPKDMKEGIVEFKHLLGAGPAPEGRTGKYPVGNKLYHHGATVATLAAIVTGLFMMVRIDNPVVGQNQYLFADGTWGWIYLLHGLAGVLLVLMVISHVYFAIRPEKRWQTRSMIKGWITRDEYLTHHDPALWDVTDGAERVESGPGSSTADPSPVVGPTT